MNIGVDIMGGDFAPKEAIIGAVKAFAVLPSSCRIVLIGDEAIAKELLLEQGADHLDFDFVHTTEVIEMGEPPTKAIVAKKDSSIVVGFGLLANKEIDVFLSAGNTGAVMVAAVFSVKVMEGVSRPTVLSVLPKIKGGLGLLVDAGTNADCKPEMLNQFAILGSLYAEHMWKINNPKVAMMNMGEEREKGNTLSLATVDLLEKNKFINFVGNIEGYHMFDDRSDVIVVDGYTGNIMIKVSQGIFKMMKKMGLSNDYFERFNYEIYGGSAVLGVNAPVIIGHGVSSAEAFKNMIFLGKDMVDSNVVPFMKERFLSMQDESSQSQ